MTRNAQSDSETTLYRRGGYYQRWLQDNTMCYMMPPKGSGPNWREDEAAEKVRPPYVHSISLKKQAGQYKLTIGIKNLNNREGGEISDFTLAHQFNAAMQAQAGNDRSVQVKVDDGGYFVISFTPYPSLDDTPSPSLDDILGWLDIFKGVAIPNLNFDFVKQSVAADKALAGLRPEDKAEFDVYTDWTRTNNKARRGAPDVGWNERPKPLRPDQNIIERIVASKDGGAIILAEDVSQKYRDKILHLNKQSARPSAHSVGLTFSIDEHDERIVHFKYDKAFESTVEHNGDSQCITHLLEFLERHKIHHDSRKGVGR